MNLKTKYMKRGTLIGYGLVLAIALSMQSCQDDPINPNSGCCNGIDTTWVNDSTDFGGGNGNPIDSTDFGGGNGTPTDSTDFGGGNGTPTDSTDFGGGNGNPADSIGV
jgi:hypothetical protein